MKNIKRIILSTVVVISMTGCMGGTPSVSSKSSSASSDLPSWYLKVQPTNPTYYYGAGSGNTKEDSKAQALSNIAGLISSTVSASMEITSTDSTDSGFNEVSKSNIKSSTDKIRFTGVTIIENENIGSKFYTNLKVDRGVLFESLKKAVDNDYAGGVERFKRMQSKGAFEVLKSSEKLQKSISNIIDSPSLPILKSVNPNFNSENYRDKVLDLSSDLDSAKRAIVIKLSSKDSLSSLYKEIVEKYISSAGVTIVTSTSGVTNKSNILFIDVTVKAKSKAVKTRDPRLRGASFADVTVTLTTKDSSKRVVAQNRINVTNISKEGLQAAKIKTKKFEREITKKGIFNTLLKATR